DPLSPPVPPLAPTPPLPPLGPPVPAPVLDEPPEPAALPLSPASPLVLETIPVPPVVPPEAASAAPSFLLRTVELQATALSKRPAGVNNRISGNTRFIRTSQSCLKMPGDLPSSARSLASADSSTTRFTETWPGVVLTVRYLGPFGASERCQTSPKWGPGQVVHPPKK